MILLGLRMIGSGQTDTESFLNIQTIEFIPIVYPEPKFPGGVDSLKNYLSKNLIYPEMALKSNICGKVFIKFIVEVDGKLSDLQIVRGIGAGCDQEVIRLVKGMPNWIPSEYHGKKLRMQYNLIVRFMFDEKNKPTPTNRFEICY